MITAQTANESPITRPNDITDEPMEALYIGGDQTLADLYKLKLEMDGYWLRLAATGTMGLAQARERIPDIVFLDLGPSDQPLLQMHRSLRRDPDLKDIPVVVLWRGGTDELTIQSLRLGANDFLVKANRPPSGAWSDLPASRPLLRYA